MAIDYAATVSQPVYATGEYRLTDSPLIMRPGVPVISRHGDALLTQSNDGNLSTLVSATAAAGAYLDGIILDMNASHCDKSNDKSIVQIWDADDIGLFNCHLNNSPGGGVYGRNGKRTRIENCTIEDVFGIPINLAAVNGDTESRSHVGRTVIKGGYGQHAILYRNLNGAAAHKNEISSYRMQGFNIYIGGYYANSAGGNYFTPDCVGKFLIYNDGIEALIVAYVSPVQVILNAAQPVYGGPYPAVWGNGDVVSFENTTLCTATDNRVDGGASLGVSVWARDGLNARGNSVRGNIISGTGAAGIMGQVGTNSLVLDTLVTDNIITDCGMNRGAGKAYTNCGIVFTGGSSMSRVVVNSNLIVGYSGSMLYGISFRPGVAGRSYTGNLISGTTVGQIESA